MKINKYILTFFAAVVVGSCESYTEDLNDDPNNFIVAASDLIIGQTQLAFMQHMGSNNARYAGVFANTMSGADRQYLTLNTYSPNRGNYNDMWGDTYLQGINTAQLILNDESAGNLVKGIASILQGALYADMAALYGDVPFSQAVNPDEYPNPVYDSQADVVNGGIALIEQGIALVGTASIAAGFGGNRLSGGTWAATGHTLAARYSLLAGNYASAISHANQGISSSANDLETQHGTSQENRNLFYQFIIDERQDYLKANNAHLVHLLDGTATRRLATPAQQLQYDYYFISDSGGAEVAFVSLVEELAKLNLEVIVYNNCKNQGLIKNVKWKKLSAKVFDEKFDVLVVNRGDKFLNFRKECKKRFFWIHNPAKYLLKFRYLSKLFFNDDPYTSSVET